MPQIKRQIELVVALMKKLKKQPFESSTKGSDDEEFDKESNHSEDFTKEHINKEESSLGSMSVE